MAVTDRRSELQGITWESLRTWAAERKQYRQRSKPWRGRTSWAVDYEEVVDQWRQEGRLEVDGFPSAFQDGEARPKQLAPGTPGSESARGEWLNWLLMMGRGFGKTRTGAEFINERVEEGSAKHIALVGATTQAVRQIMVEGESGILACAKASFRPLYEPSNARVVWPNGAVALCRTAEKPERLRGYQFDTAWCDELAAWQYLESTWDNLQFGLRLGDPRCIITTTPKPLKKLKEIIADTNTVTFRGSSFENRANLATTFFETVIKPYIGTRLGRQEIDAELLEDVEGALWRYSLLDETRWSWEQFAEYCGAEEEEESISYARRGLSRLLVAVDPNAGVADCGIVVGGRGHSQLAGRAGMDTHGFALEDCTVVKAAPHEWGEAAVDAYLRWGADRLVAEANNGGEMVESTIRSVRREEGRDVAYKAVHAAKGKYTRAEPVAALYEQHRFHHVGHLPLLEQQMCEWVPGMPSPDRMDAMVWMATEALLGKGRPVPAGVAEVLGQMQPLRRSPWDLGVNGG